MSIRNSRVSNEAKKLINAQSVRFIELGDWGADVNSPSGENWTLAQLQATMVAVDAIWKEIRKDNIAILTAALSPEEPYVAENTYNQMRRTYIDLRNNILNKISERQPQVSGLLDMSSISTSTSAPGIGKKKTLPCVELPKFSGAYEEWEVFKEAFSDLVHNDPTEPDSVKLQYLKSCLTGTAAQLVANVPTRASSYTKTWKELEIRFHNPRAIGTKLFRDYENLKPMSMDTESEVRRIIYELASIYTGLSELPTAGTGFDIFFVEKAATLMHNDTFQCWEMILSAKFKEIREDENFGKSKELDAKCFPSYKQCMEFLEERARALSTQRDLAVIPLKRSRPAVNPQNVKRAFHASGPLEKCALCHKTHTIAKCVQFTSKRPRERNIIVRRLRLCYRCLGAHSVKRCKVVERCRECKRDHNTLLHRAFKSSLGEVKNSIQENLQSKTVSNNEVSDPMEAAALTANTHFSSAVTVLPTAQADTIGPNGTVARLRILLDQGSEISIIKESVVQALGFQKRQAVISLTGIGASRAGVTCGRTCLTLRSLVNPDATVVVEAYILPRLTTRLPEVDKIEIPWKHLPISGLADPEFYKARSIDLILGADTYGRLLQNEVQHIPASLLVAQKTKLGWILSGPMPPRRSGRAGSRRPDLPAPTPRVAFHCRCEEKLYEALNRFWVIDTIAPPVNPLTPEEQECENNFIQTYRRDSTGRYSVRLPFRGSLPSVANETKRMAISSLRSIHRRFERDSILADEYRTFMNEYEKLGHMELIDHGERNNEDAWYLPHHAVIARRGLTRKIRVVFDASRKTRSGCCLNQYLSPGPVLQSDLTLILVNWRQYRFVFTADMVKMFRQIWVEGSDREKQRIVWASHRDLPVNHYRLKTVTYGTACAPYLAIRTLKQLCLDGRNKYPLAANCLEEECYVDDIFAGDNDLAAAVQKKSELIQLLHSAGIELNKWAANDIELLPGESNAKNNAEFEISNKDQVVKTLGLSWHPGRDAFIFQVQDIQRLKEANTKRLILANISSLFDPLGWLSPIIVTAKILMQDICINKVEWDCSLPEDISGRWHSYCESLQDLPLISIERRLGIREGDDLQIHGFCDASTRAFAAVVYLRMNAPEGNIRVRLLAAKSRVTPIKTVCIPNLELCGAVLVVKLVKYLQKNHLYERLPIHLWTDSQIVLAWLNKHPSHWKTFVANRVSFIQTEMPFATWSHVGTKNNPADIATRGLRPADLHTSSLWWQGPDWLHSDKSQWPRPKENARVMQICGKQPEPELLLKYSSYAKLIRVVAWCFRFHSRTMNSHTSLPDFLTTIELSKAKTAVIRLAQQHAFEHELSLLKNGKILPAGNRLKGLNPFWDEKCKIIRVGGRLSNSLLPIEMKHPPILPRDSQLGTLIVRAMHLASLHGGPSLTSAHVLQHAWILGRKALVKSIIRHCLKCQRTKPIFAQQLMGDLPVSRVTPARAFSTSGLDYAGPFHVKTTKGRGHRSHKCYIVLFVCFVSRAVHLELASDLTSEAFIAAFRRFVSRRGPCKHLFSDNATNFQGADQELRTMFRAASDFYYRVAGSLANEGTSWTFIPPNTPHYGGLWEAGVRSVKHHLRRAFNVHNLTFEEFTTALAEIEACLNSRPLRPLSSDPEDLNALTPAHLVIGAAINVIPDLEPFDAPINRLSRYQILQRIRNQFWKQWSKEYLHQLQVRGKWRIITQNLKKGQLVLLRDDRYPPTQWPLGRVVELYSGKDGLVRVVAVKTATSILKRHVARVCPLDLDEPATVDVTTQKS